MVDKKLIKLFHQILIVQAYFRPLNTSGISNPPSSDININYTKWSAMDAQFIVVGKVESENPISGNIKITWSLIDVF